MISSRPLANACSNAFDDKDVDADGRRDQSHLDHDYADHPEPDRVKPDAGDDREHDRHRDDEHGEPVEEHAKNDVANQDQGQGSVGSEAELLKLQREGLGNVRECKERPEYVGSDNDQVQHGGRRHRLKQDFGNLAEFHGTGPKR